MESQYIYLHRCLIYLHYSFIPPSYLWHTYHSTLHHLNLSYCTTYEICIFISTFTGLSHRYFTHRHTWEDAEKDCREHSAHLSSVISATEQEFINGMCVFLCVGLVLSYIITNVYKTRKRDNWSKKHKFHQVAIGPVTACWKQQLNICRKEESQPEGTRTQVMI